MLAFQSPPRILSEEIAGDNTSLNEYIRALEIINQNPGEVSKIRKDCLAEYINLIKNRRNLWWLEFERIQKLGRDLRKWWIIREPLEMAKLWRNHTQKVSGNWAKNNSDKIHARLQFTLSHQ